jgi:hypothetical protein
MGTPMDMKMMSIAEYRFRVQKLRVAIPELEAEFNAEEGLTLVATIGGQRYVYCGETDIVERMEDVARKWLQRVAESFG